jgi:hypothetical protein
MTPASLLASARSLIEGAPDDAGLIDRCNVYNVTYTNDSAGGTTAADGTAVASNVPCLLEEKIFHSGQVGGGAISNITHKLYLIASSTTRAIKPNYAIVVAARSDNPARRFESPVILEETLGPLVVLGAMLKL